MQGKRIGIVDDGFYRNGVVRRKREGDGIRFGNSALLLILLRDGAGNLGLA